MPRLFCMCLPLWDVSWVPVAPEPLARVSEPCMLSILEATLEFPWSPSNQHACVQTLGMHTSLSRTRRIPQCTESSSRRSTTGAAPAGGVIGVTEAHEIPPRGSACLPDPQSSGRHHGSISAPVFPTVTKGPPLVTVLHLMLSLKDWM